MNFDKVPLVYSQFSIVIAVGLVFTLGVCVRHILDRDSTIPILEVVAVIVGGFIMFGLLFCNPIQTLLQCSNEDYLIVAPMVPPIFASGFFARSEFRRWMRKPRAPTE